MYAQLLIALSLSLAAYEDVKERAVSDLVWIPALIGAALGLYWSFANANIWYALVKLGLVGGIALAFALFGAIGEADGIALGLIAADPYDLSPIFPLFGAAVVALVHIIYEFAVGNARGTLTIPMEKFLTEQRWIPKAVVVGGERKEVGRDVNTARDEVEAMKDPSASVEVTYGVPTVSYLGIGYVVYVAAMLLIGMSGFAARA